MSDMELKPAPVNNNPNKGSNITLGVVLVIIGAALLLRNMDLGFQFPRWIFSWPMILIVIGIITGARHQFRGAAWLILTLIGCYFLVADNRWLAINLKPFTLPVILIAVGIFVLLKKRDNRCRPGFRRPGNSNFNAAGGSPNMNDSQDEYLDITSIFASNNRRVINKNLKGGKVSCVFGGAELDLTQADFEGTIVIDMFTAFGGVELALPANWIVKNEMSVILGGIDDKRRYYQPGENAKTLILKGTVVFGGVELKSY